MLENLKSYRINLLIFILVFGAFVQESILARPDNVAAYQVKVFMKSGAEFTAVVRDADLKAFFADNKNLDPKKFDPDKMVTLHYMNGLNGSMGVRMKDLKALTRLVSLTDKELSDVKGVIKKRIDTLRDKEEVRLQKLKEKREAEKKRKEAEEAKRNKLEKERIHKETEAEKFKWIFRYPPEAGWGPDKKEELYRRAVVVGVYPNEEEQTFIDHFAEWMTQHKAWEALDKKKRDELAKYKTVVLKKMEEKAKSKEAKKKRG